ncbi:MAG: glycosyltransferase family 9 protein [Motiliproteus sp.]
MNTSPKKILVVRNDKLGDFMLSWPGFAALKQAFPEAQIVALVPNYTKPIAELCPWIDDLLIDPTENAGVTGFQQLLKETRAQRFDLMITLFSTTRIGLLGLLAGIPQRWAPATKLAQLFYNHRLSQKRSRSEKPEYQYNLDLVEASIAQYQETTQHLFSAPYLPLDADELEQLRQQFLQQQQLPESQRLIFIHAGHGGSANNLSLEQYADLAATIDVPTNCYILTAGPGELEATQQLASMFKERGLNHRLFNSTDGLQSFTKHLALAHLFIAGSTGTLHIAGALNRPTVGFYPNRRSSTPLRWRTLNAQGRYLALTPPSDIEQDMSRVDIDSAAEQIRAFLTRLYT